MKHPKVSIIILNWNGKRFLKDCLDSVFKQTYPDYEVIFVDNGSTDGSVKFVEKSYASKIGDGVLKIVANDRNYGFAKGNNIGIKKALEDKETKFIVTLNNDVIVKEDWLKKLVEKAREGYEIVNSRTYFLNGRLESAGGFLCIDGLAYPRKRGEKLGIGGGASALYAREIFEDVGFFDEDFFCYCEETDLSTRAILKNHRKIAVADESIVWHHGGASSDLHFKIYHTHRNNLWFIVKNFPAYSLTKNFLLIVATQLASIAFRIVKGQGGAILRAKIDAVKGLRKMLEKRRFIQKERKISSKEFDSILENRWVITLRSRFQKFREKKLL